MNRAPYRLHPVRTAALGLAELRPRDLGSATDRDLTDALTTCLAFQRELLQELGTRTHTGELALTQHTQGARSCTRKDVTLLG